jgi:hypothetical protein
LMGPLSSSASSSANPFVPAVNASWSAPARPKRTCRPTLSGSRPPWGGYLEQLRLRYRSRTADGRGEASGFPVGACGFPGSCRLSLPLSAGRRRKKHRKLIVEAPAAAPRTRALRRARQPVCVRTCTGRFASGGFFAGAASFFRLPHVRNRRRRICKWAPPPEPLLFALVEVLRAVVERRRETAGLFRQRGAGGGRRPRS